MTEPSELQRAVARAIVVHFGGVVISKELAKAIRDAGARVSAGLPVSLDEVAWIESELAASPGYTEYHARELLAGALAKTKALL
jgi:hypothetical protein